MSAQDAGMPKRIQRQRTKGWRMPEGAVYVGRPSRWGNPFRAGEPFRFWDDGDMRSLVGIVGSSRESQVRLFARFLAGRPVQHELIREQLAGRDLACWCPLDQPCHADVLLEIANGSDQ